MELFNPALEENITLIRPAFFFIGGFTNIPHIRYYFVFLFFLFIFSLIGNAVVMMLIVLDYTLRTPKYVAVFNLALTDLLSSTALVPKLVDIFLFNHRYISYNDCLTFMFFCFSLSAMQCLNLVTLCYDRLIAIMYPLQYPMKVTPTFMMKLTAVFWFIVIVLILVAVGLLTRLSFCKSVVINSYFCDHGPVFRLACNSNFPSRVLGPLLPALLLWCPLAFILASYCCIVIALSKISTRKERMKAFKTCMGHLSLVVIYFLPITIVFGMGSQIQPNARIINLSMNAVIPPVLNPVVYVLQTEEIKHSLQRLVKNNRRQT